MDTSEEYVKMCENADEIQSSSNGFDDRLFVGIEKKGIHKHTMYFYSYTEDIPDGCVTVWLPRQDQLQDMIIANRTIISNPINLFKVLVYWLSDTEALDFDPDGLLSFDTMEKMWLAYYMKTCHHKMWNGNGWVQ